MLDGHSLRTARPPDGTVSVATEDRSPVTGNVRDVEQGVLRTARRNAMIFGRGRDSLYGFGSDEALLGQNAAPLACSTVGVRASLDHVKDFQDIRPSTGFVPVRLSGEVDGLTDVDRAKLALAVNGRVAATTWAYERSGHGRFVALVPEHAFKAGTNSVTVYEIDTSPERTTLVALGGTEQPVAAPCRRTPP